MSFRRALAACLTIVATSGADPSAEAKGKKMGAVDKALQLLTDLKTQVLQEGEEEAKTYNKFACFCSDTTKGKLAAIQTGADAKDKLTADIQALSAKRDQCDTDIAAAVDAIKGHEEAMTQARETRAKELETFQMNSADLKAALEGLEGAIQAVKASKPAALLQLRDLPQGVRSAVALADAMGLGGAAVSHLAGAFLQTGQPVEDYKFKSDSVIATLEGLLTDFRTQRDTVDQAEVTAVQAHDLFMQQKTDLIKEEQTKLDTAQTDKSKAISDIATSSQRLSLVAATLMDDKEYASELARMCGSKARTWDQRSQTRADEVQVLTQAIEIVKGVISEKTSAATIRFAQQGVSLRLARRVVQSPAAMEAIEAAAEAAEAPRAVSFLAIARRYRTTAPEAGKRAVESLLRTRGMELKSALLTALASQISADPLAKVKTLIEELINRLQQEANNEANQKGWCDKAIAEATQKRDYASEKISNLNGELAQLEALREQLKMELVELDQGIDGIKVSQANATSLRTEEKAEHESIVKEAQEGLTALTTVIDALDKFYKTSAKAEVSTPAPASLLQRASPNEDVPDAGFDEGEAYTGAQGAAGGILGMLEVMKSDFDRTVTETQAAEKQAEQDHLEFMTESGKSLAEKEAAKTEKTRQQGDADQKFDEGKANLDAEMSTLKSSIQELIELRPACIDTGMSYEERVSHRDEEMKALEKALCILGAYSQYGQDGVAGQCE